jgi:HEAT repeat protein
MLIYAEPRPEAALPRLVELLDDADPYSRVYAAAGVFALAKDRAPGRAWVVAREALTDANANVRRDAVRVLCMAAEAAPKLIDDIAACVRDDSSVHVRRVGAMLVGRFGQASVPLLTHLLRDPDEHVRADAVANLGRLGRHARPAIPAIEALRNDSNETVRDAARRALQQLNPPAKGNADAGGEP